MQDFLLKMTSCLIRFGIRLRYKVILNNPEVLKMIKEGKRPILFLPNHPAEVDPIILFTHLAKWFKPHPLVVEKFFYLTGASFVMKLSGAISIPDFDVSVTEWKRKRGEKAYDAILNCLKKNESVLIYPSGQLKRTSKETLGGSSMVHRLIEEIKDVDIVLVRMNGLWGSSYSRGLSGDVEPFWDLCKHALKVLFKNGLFFVPKRKVTIDFLVNPKDFPKQASKGTFNRYLEKFYNQYEDENGKVLENEPLTLVSYSCFKKELPKVNYKSHHQSKFEGEVHLDQVSKDKILNYLRKLIEDPNKEIHEHDHLSHQLGLDSLDVANCYAFVTKTFDVRFKVEPGDVRTVHDLYYIATQKNNKVVKDPSVIEATWKNESGRPNPMIFGQCSIGASFIKRAKLMKNLEACKDATTPFVTYNKLLLTALVLSQKFEKLPGKYIGVMLPASVGVYAIILGLFLAKKVPVMLNWTVGVRSLKHAKDLLGFQVVLSSQRFLDRMEFLDLTPIEDELVLMEDLRRTIGLNEKLTGALLSKLSSNAIIKRLKLDQVDVNEPAAVLFTSGTESFPKAVPLSHENILTNLACSLDQIELRNDEILYGVLPPFHSFGFTVTGLFPLLVGIRTYYAPDPTDAYQIALDADQYKPTMICLAPSFYMNLFRVAKKEQLKSIRLFVTGAEKAPPELYDYVASIGGDNSLLEGYGITECSPIVSINQPNRKGASVGLPLPILEIKIIHTDTLQEIDPSLDGEICIFGSSVFRGYLGDGKKDPFILLDGKKFYRSGDIGHLDPVTGDLILAGRLKRFVKIGGEMVSLLAIEHELVASIKKESETDPIFVVSPLETENEKTRLAILTNCSVTRDSVNESLKDSGFGRIVKIAHVKVVDEVPLLGSGKIDFRKIDEILKSETLN
jgi:long-chain-fatty-acid--[acyl-carrier-protein] ligase